MSFGYGVGDVIAVSTLARTIWGRFRDASDQFRAIQTDVFGLHRVLDDVANNLSGLQITDEQRDNLSKLVEGCRSVLNDTEKLIQKNQILDTKSSGISSKKVLRKLKWDSTTVNELRDRMISRTTFLNAFNTSLASQLSRATNDKVEEIAKDTSTLRLNQSQKDRKEILQWLSPINFGVQQSDLSSRRQAGTGDWFLESPEFQEWVNKEGATLVCQGMPGAGKTMLASRIIDHLEKFSNEENTAIVYIYCDYGKQEEQTAIRLAENVTKQLLQHQDSIPERVLKIYQHHCEKVTRPNLGEVLEMTACSMVSLSRIFLIVDALDELGNTGKVRQSFIQHLRQLQDLHHFNLMTTSREIPNLALDFQQPRSMDLRANPGDIRRYVQGHIGNLSSCVENNASLQETIASTIVDSVDGMFLLAQLHMDSLSDKTSIKMVKKALDALPKGSKALALAYDGAMQRIDSQLEGYRHLAKQLLGWLTYSERLMSVQEIQYALAIEPGESSLDKDNLSDVIEIVGYCAGLVIVEEDTRSLRLVHYTTQDYFRQNSGKHLVAAQQDIAISCLTYLSYEEFGDGWVYEFEGQDDSPETHLPLASQQAAEVRLQQHPFLGYAARYWTSHAIVCEQQVIEELTMSFARHDHKVSSAGQAMLMVENNKSLIANIHETGSSKPLSAMHVLAYVGYKAMVTELLNLGFEADAEDCSGKTPLWWAVEGGQHAMVEFLLSEKVNVNNRGYFNFAGTVICTPLHEAASHGHTSIVKLLLNQADIDVNVGGYLNQTALFQATAGGHNSIVELLLDCANIDANIPDVFGSTPLHIAVVLDYTAIVKLLLDCANVDVNIPDDNGRTPLHKAAARNYPAMVWLLLDCADVDVNVQDEDGRTPLQEAAVAICTSIVELLCAYPKTDLNSRDNRGRDVFSQVKDAQVKDLQASKLNNKSNEFYDERMLAREECLDIISTAIEERKSGSSGQLAEQKQPALNLRRHHTT